jgi:hypothetical protein
MENPFKRFGKKTQEMGNGKKILLAASAAAALGGAAAAVHERNEKATDAAVTRMQAADDAYLAAHPEIGMKAGEHIARRTVVEVPGKQVVLEELELDSPEGWQAPQ